MIMTLIHNHNAFKPLRILLAILVLSTAPVLVFGWGSPQNGVQGSEVQPNKEFPATAATMPMNVNEVPVNHPPTSDTPRRTIEVPVTETFVEIDLSDITDADNDNMRYFRRYYGNVSDGGFVGATKTLTVNYNLIEGETAQVMLRVVDTDQEHEDGKSAFLQSLDLVGVQP